jgi:aspartyl-tRNA(Asn)/glutamyl-tRNA(Gln) amidotransferase subunit B
MEFETVIGLEIHVELATQTKIFCNCKNEFGAPPNSHVCPVCMGSPGVLPVLNEEALKLGIRAALALNCEVRRSSKFDRKNYFYPDSPKAYQISQYDEPIGEHGFVEIVVNGEVRRIGITRVHLEEDAGKLNHADFGDASYVDLNRAGVPLIEIVSEPDIRSAEEARLFLEELKATMQYCLISDCKMEEGSLRCDANISLRPMGQEQLGTKTEIKNMNSFRNVQRGLDYEWARQDKILRAGNTVQQQTLRWDEASASTILMRSKEDAHDYRYFPEPDLPRVLLSEEYIQARLQEVPELPMARRHRFESEYGIPAYDAGVLTASRALADYFAEAAQHVKDPKTVSNMIMGDVLGYLKTVEKEINELPMKPVQLAALISLMEDGTISSKIAKNVLKEMLESGKEPKTIIADQGLVQISDEGQLSEIAQRVLAANPKSVEDYRAGKEKALGALVGQMMKETKGKANPQMVNKIIVDLINQA